MEKKIVKYLGIDFGSSSTSVVGIVEGEQKPIVFLSEDRDPLFASVILQRDDKEYFFAEAFEEVEKGGVLHSSLKEDIAVKDVNSESAKRAKKFLTRVVEIVKKNKNENWQEGYDFSQVEGVCYGHPAYIGKNAIANYCWRMEDILTELFKPKNADGKKKNFQVNGYPEPILGASAYQYAHRNDGKIREGDVVLVLDFGGYTLDIAVMKAVKGKNGVQLVKMRSCVSLNTKGDEELDGDVFVGKTITMDLCREIYGKTRRRDVRFDAGVDEAKCKLFTDWNDKKKVEGVSKFLEEGKSVKYVLEYEVSGSADCEDPVYVGFKGESGKRSIGIERKYRVAAKNISTYLASISDDLKDAQITISRVLFTGGTSKIKPLRDAIIRAMDDWRANGVDDIELLMDDSKEKILLDPTLCGGYSLSSDNAVALGAALVAAGKCSPMITVAKQNADKKEETIKELESEKKKLQMQLAMERLKLGKLSDKELLALRETLAAMQGAIWSEALESLVEKKALPRDLSDSEKALIGSVLEKIAKKN